MPGRRHVAAQGEAVCPAEDCERPAGFGTATPGEGPCRRHGGARLPTPLTLEAAPLGNGPSESPTPLSRRLRGPGRPARDPLLLARVILTLGRRAGFPFEEAYDLAVSTALAYMSDRRAGEVWNALAQNRAAWAKAYERRSAPVGDGQG